MFLFKKESILTEYILKDYLLLYFITNIIAVPDAHHFFSDPLRSFLSN